MPFCLLLLHQPRIPQRTRRCINQESRNGLGDSSRIFSRSCWNNAKRQYHKALFIRFAILHPLLLCVCNTGVEIITDTFAFGEGFCSLVVQQDKIRDCHRTIFLVALHRQATIRNSSHHKWTEINSNNYLQYTSKSMCTIIHSTEAVTASSSAPSTCFAARGDVWPAELNCWIYSIIFWQLLYANYDVWHGA